MAFKMKGFSPFTQKQDNLGPNSTTDGDEVSGRTQIEEIKHDIARLKEDIKNPKYPIEIINKFKKALRENEAALIRLQKAKNQQ
tara:strand:+ start:1023 stop:1274 length:252 start_codon:yes stop_codon:yes gene_type:complete